MSYLKIASMIAAAGTSSRMSFQKAFLNIQEEPMLITTIKIIARTRPVAIYVTLSPRLFMRSDVRHHVRDLSIDFFLNRFMEHGYAGSIKTVIEAAPWLDGLLIMPVDAPLLTPHLIMAMMILARSQAHKPQIIVPSYFLSPGHPVFISRHFFGYFMRKKPLTLRQVIARHGRFKTDLAWPDRCILYNLNSDQLVRLFFVQNPGANKGEAAAIDAPGVNFS